jgi:hypothetical protein
MSYMSVSITIRLSLIFSFRSELTSGLTQLYQPTQPCPMPSTFVELNATLIFTVTHHISSSSGTTVYQTSFDSHRHEKTIPITCLFTWYQ